jgi:predicted transcriptional regulator of viral defense system
MKEYLFGYSYPADLSNMNELLEIKSAIIEQLQEMKTNSYVLLDTELPKTGKRLSRWRIQQNLETETITAAIYT